LLDPPTPPYNIEFQRYDIDRISRSRTAAYHFLNINRERLEIPHNQDIAVIDLYDTDKVVEAGRRLPREIILEYLWREDIHLEGQRFGYLEGEIAQLLCGGTIVFDGRGNVLYLVKKPGLSFEKDIEEGKQRKNNLLDYIEHLVGGNRIGLIDEARRWGLDSRTPGIAAHNVSGGLQLMITPHLRNHGKKPTKEERNSV
jgi:hypothetical protein